VKGIPLDNRNCPTASYAGSTIARTLAVDRHSLSLNNVDYVRILIGNLDVSLVPPVVPHVNIGSSFYDPEFTREIATGRPIVEPNAVHVQGNQQMTNVAGNVNVGNMNAGHTPKRSTMENPRTNVPQSAPSGFMRDARRTYENSGIPTHRPAQWTVVVETDIRRNRKAVEENVLVDSDEDEVSLNTQIQNVGHAFRLADQVEATSSKVVDDGARKLVGVC
jgi:hypothetical protein